MTTVASVLTHAQFVDGDAIKGNALGLQIAAGNVPNFVSLESGGWGEAILGPLNSGQTPTIANFATLADALSGCAVNDACAKLFAAATPPKGNVPTDTLSAAQSIARYPWYQPERLFRLLDAFYPVPAGKTMRPCSVHAIPEIPSECLGAAVEVCWGGYRAGGRPCSTAKQLVGWGQLYVSNTYFLVDRSLASIYAVAPASVMSFG
jgi:hypothetical protein